MSRTKTILSSLTLFSTLLLAAGCGGNGPAAEQQELPVVHSALAPVERISEPRTIEVFGVVQPARQAVVSSRVSGPVTAVKVSAGDLVRKGQTLMEIEPDSIEGQVSQARGALAQAQAALSLAEKNYARFQELQKKDAASEVELDMARMQYEQAQGAVAQAEGAVQTASSVAGEAMVTAPFNARVVEKMAEVGDMAAPGRPLVRLESRSGSQIRLTVREADIARVSLGQTIEVSLDARPELGRIEGTVDEIAAAADPATHTFTVKVGLPLEQAASGASGRGYLAGAVVERLTVPASAVHARGGLELVVIRGEDGRSRTRSVTTGRTLDDGTVEILSGLAAGEQALVGLHGPVPDSSPVEVAK
jgi:RND family efflux transporter MFP subunit